MVTVTQQNFSRQTQHVAPAPRVTYDRCNFEQDVPHTRLTFVDEADGRPLQLVFVRCNLRNCDLPQSVQVTLVDCKTAHVVVETVVEEVVVYDESGSSETARVFVETGEQTVTVYE